MVPFSRNFGAHQGGFYAIAELKLTIGFRLESLYLSSLVQLKVLDFEKKPLSNYIGNLTTGRAEVSSDQHHDELDGAYGVRQTVGQ